MREIDRLEPDIEKYNSIYGLLPIETLPQEKLRPRINTIVERANRLKFVLDNFHLEPPFEDSEGTAWDLVQIEKNHVTLFRDGEHYKEAFSISNLTAEGNVFIEHNTHAWQTVQTNNEPALKAAEDAVDKLFSRTEKEFEKLGLLPQISQSVKTAKA